MSPLCHPAWRKIRQLSNCSVTLVAATETYNDAVIRLCCCVAQNLPNTIIIVTDEEDRVAKMHHRFGGDGERILWGVKRPLLVFETM